MRKCIACLIFLVAVAPGFAAELKIAQDQTWVLLATTKTSTMQKELDEASAKGFRVVAGSPTSGTEIAILMKKTTKAPSPYQYRLLATSRTGTMQEELNAAAREGFRLLPSIMVAKNSTFVGPEIALLMERPPKNQKRYKYQLLATTRTSTMQKEILEYLDYGFTVAGMVSRGEHMVIMEQEIQENPQGGLQSIREPEVKAGENCELSGQMAVGLIHQ